MADLLERRLRVYPRLKRGSGGVFSVAVDGRVVASKGWLGFPTDDEILEAVAHALGREPPE